MHMTNVERQRRRPGAGRPAQNTYGDNSPASKTFGPWLASMIQARGLNQAEFADKVKASPTTVSRWINGRVPNAKYIQPIADVLLLDYDLVATRAGIRPRSLLDRHNDPESAEAQLMPLIQRINWTPERLQTVLALLGSLVEVSRNEATHGTET